MAVCSDDDDASLPPHQPTPAALNLRRLEACNGEKDLIPALINSRVFQDYEHAFSAATGLPVALRSVETWQLPLHGKRNEGPWCALMAERSRCCVSCLQVQERLAQAAVLEPYTGFCPAGLCETMVPVRLGDRLVGFLQTGQVFRKEPTAGQFERAAKMLADRGVQMDQPQMKAAYFSTRVFTPKRHEAVIKMLSIFSQHLSLVCNETVVSREGSEMPIVSKAKEYIQEHQAEDLSLAQVAKAVHTSTFYFCKIFKRVTGINFTDYVSRTRIERSKYLLLNPNLRVSEIAFEAGFQSLTHFNRVFNKVLGQAPTKYRKQLLGAQNVPLPVPLTQDSNGSSLHRL